MKKHCFSVLLLLLAVSFSASTINHIKAAEIHEAVVIGNYEKVKTLITSNPSLLNSKDENGNTPLHHACGTGQVEIAKYLIDQNADLNSKNNSEFTPLLRACGGMNPDLGLVKYLIEKGADINAKLERGLTAIHFAAMSENYEIIKLLIDKGVDLNIYDFGCYGTPLHIAINSGGNEKIIKMLLESGAELTNFSFGNSELHLAAIKGFTHLIKLLVGHGAKINTLNEYSHTPVYYAAKHGYRNTVEALLEAGADKNSIVETNFGKATELTSKLKNKEAWLWYIGGLYGQGYAVKTKNHLLVFDKTETDDSPEAGLANGKLNPAELKGQDITVFITKTQGLANKSQPFQILEELPETNLIIDSDLLIEKLKETGFKDYKIAVPIENISTGSIQIRTIPALSEGYGGARGMGYIVEVDGLRIYHSGFNVSGYPESEREEFRKVIDKLKSYGPIDIAILTVGGHLTVAYLPYLYLIDQLSPKAIYLMGGDQATEEYINCINVLKEHNVPVYYPEGGIIVGERFHYIRD